MRWSGVQIPEAAPEEEFPISGEYLANEGRRVDAIFGAFTFQEPRRTHWYHLFLVRGDIRPDP